MRSSLQGLTCALAAIAIGCGTRELDPRADAGAGPGGSTGIGVDGGTTGNAGAIGIDAAPRPDLRPPILIEACGNGLVDTGEECDDGNHTPGDGCGASCQIECHWTCGSCGVPGPCVVNVICGDGLLGPGETCDDGNVTSGDGCAASCAVEPGWLCPVPGRRCSPICGDGNVIGPETCDDGNSVAGDGCSDICLAEPNDARCGDGVISGAEPCDDGVSGFTGYGGCTTGCRLGGYCGDGVTSGPEECDLGASQNISTYGNVTGCAPGCRYPHFCGDGIVDSDELEDCDLGLENGYHDPGGYSPCSVDCHILIN